MAQPLLKKAAKDQHEYFFSVMNGPIINLTRGVNGTRPNKVGVAPTSDVRIGSHPTKYSQLKEKAKKMEGQR